MTILRITTRLLAAAGLIIPSLMVAQSTPPTARIDGGTVEGAVGGGVMSFKGIPYAAPPVGELRWRAPQPVAAWSGTRAATEYGADCPQLPLESDAAPLGTTPGENCLVLNVWRPASLAAGERLPVMVWIPGGGFVNGGSSASVYDGSAFARQGIVVVSINYRLGRLGYFAHPALSRTEEGRLANFGYLDQLAALRWIQRNIEAFGGDRGSVTLVGESAGGQSVIDHMTTLPGRDLFHRAVIMSGGGRGLLGGFPLQNGTRRNPAAEAIGTEFARSVGVKGSDERALAALRRLPAERVVARTNMVELLVTALLPRGPLTFANGPIIDGTLVRDTAEAFVERGDIAPVPVMIGTTSGDLGVWLPLSKRRLFASFGPDADRAKAIYDPTGDGKLLPVVYAAAGDRTMQEPARFFARAVSRKGQPAWLYRFGYVSDSTRKGAAGAGHASELPYLFGTLDARYGSSVTERDREISRAFLGYFANFVKRGDPNGESLPHWSRVNPASDSILEFPLASGPVMRADPLRERLDLMQRASETQPKPIMSAELARPDWTGFIAVGALRTPRYLGSDESRLVVVPLADIAYRQRYFASVATTGMAAAVGAHVYDDRTWRASLSVGLAEFRPDSAALLAAERGDRALGTNVGGTLLRRSGFFSQTLNVVKGLDSGAGVSATLGGALNVPLSLSGALSVGVNAVFADRREMRYDFAAAGARSSLVPGGGLQQLTANATLVRLIRERYLAAAIVSAGQLPGRVAESPLVRDRSPLTVALGLGRRF